MQNKPIVMKILNKRKSISKTIQNQLKTLMDAFMLGQLTSIFSASKQLDTLILFFNPQTYMLKLKKY